MSVHRTFRRSNFEEKGRVDNLRYTNVYTENYLETIYPFVGLTSFIPKAITCHSLST